MSTVDPGLNTAEKQLKFHLDNSGLADSDKLRVWNAIAGGMGQNDFVKLADTIPNFPDQKKLDLYNFAYVTGAAPLGRVSQPSAWDYIKNLRPPQADVGNIADISSPVAPQTAPSPGSRKTVRLTPPPQASQPSVNSSGSAVHEPGRLERGNLDVFNRPVLDNITGQTLPAGSDVSKLQSYSTTSSFSFDEDGKEVLVPSVVNGVRLSEADAIQHYRQTGQHLGKFDSPEAADAYANRLHEAQVAYAQSPISPTDKTLFAPSLSGQSNPLPHNLTQPGVLSRLAKGLGIGGAPTPDSKALAGFPTLADAQKARAIQSPQDLFALGANVASGLIRGTTLGIYDPETGALRMPITGQMLYQLRDKPLSRILEEDIGARPEVARDPLPGQVGEFGGYILPWEAVSGAVAGTLNKVFGPAATDFASGLVRRLLNTLGTAGVVGTIAPKPEGEAKTEQVANTMALATVMHVGAEAVAAVGQAWQKMPWKAGSARSETLGDVIDTIRDVILKERPEVTPADASDYASKIVRDEIEKQGGWTTISQNWLRDILDRAKQRYRAYTAEFVGEPPAPEQPGQITGEAPPKPVITSSVPAEPREPSAPPVPGQQPTSEAPQGIALAPQETPPFAPTIDRPAGGWAATPAAEVLPPAPPEKAATSPAEEFPEPKEEKPVAKPPTPRVPPPPIPEPTTPVDKLIHQTADIYLGQIRDLVHSGATEMTGKVRRDHPEGPIVGRFGGGFKDQFPFLDGFDDQPGEIADAIDSQKGFLYTRLRHAAIDWVREHNGDAIQEHVDLMSPDELDELMGPAPTAHDFKPGDRVKVDEGMGQIHRILGTDVKIALDPDGRLSNWIPMSRVTRDVTGQQAAPPTVAPPVPRPDLKAQAQQALEQEAKPADIQSIKDRLKARGQRSAPRPQTPPPLGGGTFGRVAPGLDDLDDQDRDDLIALGAHQFKQTPSRADWLAAMVNEIGDWPEPYLPKVFDLIYDASKQILKRPPPASAPPPAPQPAPEASTEPQPEPSGTPHEVLARNVAAILRAGESIDNPRLTELANIAFGGTRGEGKYDPRDSYDAVEVAVNMVIQDPGVVDFDDVPGTLERLRRLTSQLPRQADRTTEQVEFQQFSTPPEEAFAAVIASGIRKGMDVLEPSAGTGNLATMMKLAGGRVQANEIAPRRQDMLRMLEYPVTSVDAQFLNSLLSDDIKPDVIVMNPPFSATGGRTKSHDTQVGADHVEEALARLNPGGRLVAIVGRGMAHDRPTFSGWWEGIEERFNVRANIGIDGKYYQKYGTGFDNQIIVIDKTGQTPGAGRAERLSNIIKASGLSPEEAIQLLQALGKEDVQSRTARPEPAGGTATGGSLRPGTRPGLPGATSTDSGSAPGGQRPDLPPEGVGGAGPATVGPVDVTPQQPSGSGGIQPPPGDAQGGLAGTEGPAGPAEVGGVSGEGGLGRPGTAGPSVSGIDTEKPAEARFGEADSENYQKYVVKKAIVPGSVPHPADMVESATLASVEPPDVTYKVHLPEEVIKEGRLSELQLEAVIYNGQRQQIILPNGERAGFWDGDGTGSGKGRIIAGIIYDNLLQGRTRAVWVSYAHHMKEPARTDLRDVGVPVELHAQNEIETDGDLPDKDGVVFTTYGMLANEWTGDRRRYNQLLRWLGDREDPVFIFDEGHKMKNAVGTQQGGVASADEGSDQGAMGLELNKQFPLSRVSYFSATGATVPRNMAYMARLGMWGPGSAFPNFIDFLDAMTRGGLGAMEMLARDLKATGSFIARSISYRGIEYGQVAHELTPDEVVHYNRMGDVWGELQLAFDAAAKKANSRHQNSRWTSQFYSAQQRFFLQVMTSLQLPDLFEKADQDLKEGKKVVISLFSTNEGQVKKKVAQAQAAGLDLGELDLTPRDIILGFIEKFFPLEQWTTQYDPAIGKEKPVKVLDANGNPVINKENLAKRQELLDKVADVYVPENPLDAIVNHFGAHRVSEISGRKHRLEGSQYVRRKLEDVPVKEVNIHEIARFQEGRTDVAIVTGAGAAGISLHDTNLYDVHKRRVLYAMQLPWSADQQMQVAPGRVHRSNQASAPIIRLMRTNLSSQERLINTVSARLASAGALTEGSRETKGGGLFAIQDLTDSYGEAALARAYEDMSRDRVNGAVTGSRLLERMGLLKRDAQGRLGVMNNTDMADVDKFLNRIMALHFDEQNAVFNNFYQHYQDGVRAAQEAGTFDPGVTKVQGTDITLKDNPTTLYTDPHSKAETRLVTLEGSFPTGRYPWDTVLSRLKSQSTIGLYVNKRSGRIYLAQRWYDQSPTVALDSPTGASHTLQITGGSVSRSLEEGHIPMRDLGAAQNMWATEYDATPAYLRKPIYMITGAIFPIYDKVVGIDTQHLGSVRVVRAVLNHGASYIGLQIRPNEINGLKQRLGIGVALTKATGAQVFEMVKTGASIVLDNDWRIRMTKVHSEPRMEVAAKYPNREEMLRYGLKEEIVDFKRRFFVPLDQTSGPAAIDKILVNHKAIRDETSATQSKLPDDDQESGRRGGGLPDLSGPASTGTSMPRSVQPPPSGAAAPQGPPANAAQAVQQQTGADIIGKREILKELAERLNVPLRTGRFRGKNVLGIFKIRQEVVRSRQALDLDTAAHEFGHAINKILWGTGGKGGLQLNLGPLIRFRSELDPIATQPGKGQDTLPEGFAEFIRMYLTQPDMAKQVAPGFYTFFENELRSHPDLEDTLRAGQDNIRRWKQQPAAARILSHISVDEDLLAKGSRWEAFYRGVFDKFDPIKRVVDQLGPMDTESDPYKLARLFAGWMGKATAALENGTFDPETLAPAGKSLKEIIKPMAEKLDDLRAYLIARRVIEKTNQGIDTGFSVLDAQETIRALETPELQAVASDLYDYQNWLLIYLSVNGLVSPEQAIQIRKMNADFVPFYRVMEATSGEGVDARGGGSGARFADLWSPVKRMKGSGRMVIDPLESIIKNTYMHIQIAERNKVGIALVAAASKSEATGRLVESVTTPMRPISFSLERIRSGLQAAGVDIDTIDIDHIATLFMPATKVYGDNVIAVLNNGERKFYQLQPDLYRAMEGLDQETVGPFLKLLSVPASLLRVGATSLSPDFAMLRGPLRDAMTAFMQSQHGFKPGIDTWRGLFHVLKRDDLYWEWMRSGGAYGAMSSLDRPGLQQHIQDLLASPFGYMLRHPIHAMGIFGETSLAISRVGEYALARNAGETPNTAAMDSRNVIADYARRGNAVQAIRLLYAFWSPSLQHFDRARETYAKNPWGTILKGTALTLASLLLYMWNRKDPAYDELPWYIKDFLYVASTKGTSLEHLIPFVVIAPKPGIYGMLHSSIPERVFSWIDKRDPHAFEDLGSSIARTLPRIPALAIPNVPFLASPTAAEPVIDAIGNYSSLTGRPLMPQWMMQLPAEYRYDYYTSEVSKFLAEEFDKFLPTRNQVSPIQIDTVFNGYTGGFGKLILDALNPAIRAARGTTPPPAGMTDLPLLDALTVRYPSGELQSVQRFYNRLQDLQQTRAAVRESAKTGAFAPPPMSDADRNELASLNAAAKEIAGIRREIKDNLYDPAKTPEQRRAFVLDREMKIANTAKEAIDTVEGRSTPPLETPMYIRHAERTVLAPPPPR